MNIIISGEKIQQLCDVYLGFVNDFQFNPIIQSQSEKCVDLNNINNLYDNPRLIFCYTHNLSILSDKIHFFKNNFILVSHNSDHIVDLNNEIKKILEYPKLIKFYCQNLCFFNEKINLLPIGIANSMWPHSILNNPNIYNIAINSKKNNNIFFNFTIQTNYFNRMICYELLINKINWIKSESPENYIINLSTYKFCICPEGNGVDTHRLWECLYLKVVPIVINSEFTQTLLRYNIPLHVINNWNELDISKLNYDLYNFNDEKFKKILYFNKNYINDDANVETYNHNY
jgi:hypothetical protein